MKTTKYKFTKRELENSLFESANIQKKLYENLRFVNKIFGKTPLAEKVKRVISKKSTKDVHVYNMLMKEGYASKYDMLCEYMDYRNEDEILFDTGGMMEDDQWPGGEVDPAAAEDYERELYGDGEFHLGRSKDDEFGFYDDDDGDFMDRPYYDDEAYTKDFLSVKDDPMDEDDDYIEGYDDDDYYIDEMCEECGDKKKGYTHSDMLYELEDGEEDFEGDDDLDFEGDREMSRKSDGMFKNPNNMMPENWVVERNGKRLRLTFNKKLMSESLFKTKIQRFEKMGYDVKAFPTKVLMEKYMRK